MHWSTLYDYWFAEIEDSQAYIDGRLPIWFFCSAEADAHIRDTFYPWIDALTPEIEAEWKQTARGFLSLILLLDQVPRNAHRGTPAMFTHDARGLALAEELRASPLFGELSPIERFWIFLPYQHQEDMAGQDMSVSGVYAQADAATSGHKRFFGVARDMADRHHKAISLFGRFPHRNVILGRDSSPEEVAFLEDPRNHF